MSHFHSRRCNNIKILITVYNDIIYNIIIYIMKIVIIIIIIIIIIPPKKGISSETIFAEI